MLESGRDRQRGSRSTPCEYLVQWAAAVFPKCDRRPKSAVSNRGAESVVADSRKDHFRIVLFEGDASAVGQREFTAHAECLPIGSAIGADTEFIGESDHCTSRFAGQRLDVMNVGLVHESAGRTRPGVAAVLAYPDAVHFDSGPDKLVIYGIHHQSSHTWCRNVDAFRRKIRRELFPVLTAVLRAKERRRRGSGKHSTWLHGVESDPPNFVSVHCGIDMLKVSATVLAAIDAVVGAGVNHARIFRMDGEAEDRSPALVSLPQFAPRPAHTSIGAAP